MIHALQTFIKKPWVKRSVLMNFYPAILLFFRQHVPRHGAALAYYSVFSVAPLLVVITVAISLLVGMDQGQAAVNDYLIRFLGPQESQAILKMTAVVMNKVHSKGIASWIAILTTIFGATVVVLELKAAMDSIWSQITTEDEGRWRLIKSRITGLGIALGVGFLLATTLMLESGIYAAVQWSGVQIPGQEVLLGLIDYV